MELLVLGSNSFGNGYILRDSQGKSLLIEAGVSYQSVGKALDWEVLGIAGCIISHEHLDHARYARYFLGAGIDVYASPGTVQKLDTNHYRLNVLEAKKTATIGPFKVMGFKVEHDAAEPFGFLIQHPEMGRLVFLTDTHYCPYVFPEVNHFLIEANHSWEIVEEKVRNGMPEYRSKRIFTSHMSLETCLETLKKHDMSHLRSIVLIHLSDGNSHELNFIETVIRATGKPTYAARPGLKLTVNQLTPF